MLEFFYATKFEDAGDFGEGGAGGGNVVHEDDLFVVHVRAGAEREVAFDILAAFENALGVALRLAVRDACEEVFVVWRGGAEDERRILMADLFLVEKPRRPVPQKSVSNPTMPFRHVAQRTPRAMESPQDAHAGGKKTSPTKLKFMLLYSKEHALKEY